MGPPDMLPDGTEAGSYYLELEAAESVEECRRMAAQFGCELIGEEVGLISPREAPVAVGKLLAWAQEGCPKHRG